MSDNVKNLGPLFVTHCAPPKVVGYHRSGLIYFTQTREYDWPFRFGRGVGLRLPHLLIELGGDGHKWFRLTSRVHVTGFWRSTKERRAFEEEDGLMWALKVTKKGSAEEWDADEEGVLAGA